MRIKLFIQLLLYSVICIAPSASAQAPAASNETLIRNATVLTITRGTLANTDVLIRNGKIAAVGNNLKA
jgi:imidazolonepropionase-like amidohydrolase